MNHHGKAVAHEDGIGFGFGDGARHERVVSRDEHDRFQIPASPGKFKDAFHIASA
jgi:hypothetical protein